MTDNFSQERVSVESFHSPAGFSRGISEEVARDLGYHTAEDVAANPEVAARMKKLLEVAPVVGAELCYRCFPYKERPCGTHSVWGGDGKIKLLGY